MKVWKIIFLSKGVIFRFHVSFPGSKPFLELESQTPQEAVNPTGQKLSFCLPVNTANEHQEMALPKSFC